MLETSCSLSFSVWKNLQCFESCQNTPRIIQMQSLFVLSVQCDMGCSGGKEIKSLFLSETSAPSLLCLCSLVQSSCVNVKSNIIYNTTRNMSNWSIKGLASEKFGFSIFFMWHFFRCLQPHTFPSGSVHFYYNSDLVTKILTAFLNRFMNIVVTVLWDWKL